MWIQVSKNELTTTLQKAAVGQGFDQGTGQWLAFVGVRALENAHPALAWVLKALTGEPAPPEIERRAGGWICLNRAVLIAGPILTDLHMAGQSLEGQGFTVLDVPMLWTQLLNDGFFSAPPHHMRIDTRLDRPVRTPGPLSIDVQEWQSLQKIAAKTYVPTTAESRERGAG